MSSTDSKVVRSSEVFRKFLCNRSPPSRTQIVLNLLAFVNDHTVRMKYEYQRVERLYQALKSLYMYDVSMPGSKLETIFYCFNFSDFDDFDLFKLIVINQCDTNVMRSTYV